MLKLQEEISTQHDLHMSKRCYSLSNLLDHLVPIFEMVSPI